MSETFGTLPGGRAVTRYVLQRDGGPRVELLDLGATVNSLRLVGDDPSTEVAIGFTDLSQRTPAAAAHFGAVVGRYANRLAEGRFAIDGDTFQVTQNEGTTALHGGVDGFDARLWTVVESGDEAITLELVSPDGDQGFPGELTARATYRLLPDGLRLELTATTTAPTVCALTNHLYLNLDRSAGIDGYQLQVEADRYVPIDAHSIPLGRLDDVTGTPFDLRQPTRIAEAVRTDDEQVGLAKGIDHSFDVNCSGLRRMARVACPSNGRVLEVHSDQPALQVYTGNFLDGTWTERDGRRLRQGDALALEPHVHPDSPNQPWPGDAVLRPGETFASAIEWRSPS